MRIQLQAEIRELRGRDEHTGRREGEGHTEIDEGGEEGEGGGVQEKGEERRQGFGVVRWETEVAVLQADLAKVSPSYTSHYTVTRNITHRHTVLVELAFQLHFTYSTLNLFHLFIPVS